MTGKRPSYNAKPVSDLSVEILDPVLRRRAGISVGLVQSWEEIVGARTAAQSRPEKILWPRRAHEDDPFQPATIVIACEARAALHLQHEAGEIISRINGFLGYPAINRLRLVQKPVALAQRKMKPPLRVLDQGKQAQLDAQLADVEDEGLRAALARLGQTVLGRPK
jgi:hypothetical protein